MGPVYHERSKSKLFYCDRGSLYYQACAMLVFLFRTQGGKRMVKSSIIALVSCLSLPPRPPTGISSRTTPTASSTSRVTPACCWQSDSSQRQFRSLAHQYRLSVSAARWRQPHGKQARHRPQQRAIRLQPELGGALSAPPLIGNQLKQLEVNKPSTLLELNTNLLTPNWPSPPITASAPLAPNNPSASGVGFSF